jgi:hypothetical protein
MLSRSRGPSTVRGVVALLLVALALGMLVFGVSVPWVVRQATGWVQP